MTDNSTQNAGQLRSAVEQIAEQFAAACGASGSRREVRDLADDLVIELIAALGKASLGEVAQTVDALERRRKSRPPRAKRTAPENAGRWEAGRWEAGARGRRQGEPGGSAHRGSNGSAGVSSRERDPFDITKPSELLDQVLSDAVHSKSIREEEPPASVRRVRTKPPADGERTTIIRSHLHAPPAAHEKAEEKKAPPPPAIVLREGERLVRSSGSGVVIRRARSA